MEGTKAQLLRQLDQPVRRHNGGMEPGLFGKRLQLRLPGERLILRCGAKIMFSELQRIKLFCARDALSKMTPNARGKVRRSEAEGTNRQSLLASA